MDKLVIQGQSALHGELEISGAKNAALPILIASLLTEEKLSLTHLPHLQDVITTKSLLQYMGVNIQAANNSIQLTAKDIHNKNAPYERVKTMRASILVLGPLLARFGEARVSLPGGCAIGSRPVDIHIKGLQAMGAKIDIHGGYIEASTKHLPKSRLQGAKFYMDIVTVTGTENLMMAASLAEGITTLENAAKEPEIVDLGECLNKMGAKIQGLGTDIITIEGVDSLHAANHDVIFDRIEAGTYLAAVAMTGGDVLLKNVQIKCLDAITQKLMETGVKIESYENSIRIRSDGKLKAVSLRTAPYPAFPTDMQAQMMALNTIAEGVSEITETIFENRFMHVQELIRMGAQIDIRGNTAIIRGKEYLEGASVMATDLRASASLVIASLAARGQTTIERIYHLDRGYEKLEDKLNQLGANIKRIH